MSMGLGMVKTVAHEYHVLKQLGSGETYDIFLGSYEADTGPRRVMMKIVGDVTLNGFAAHEAKVLRRVNQSLVHAKLGNRLMIPEIIEQFEYHDGRCVVVTDYAAGYYNLEEILERYPRGVSPQHVAWMFRRMLAAIMAGHSAGVVHGKVLPHNVLIFSGTREDDLRHTCVLVDWTCSVQDTEPRVWPRITSKSEGYDAFYPSEVARHELASPQTDLAMVAACAQYLLGGDVATGEVPTTTPWGMAQLLQQCRDQNPARRPRDLAAFDDQFQRMLVPHFGPSKFVELLLPRRS